MPKLMKSTQLAQVERMGFFIGFGKCGVDRVEALHVEWGPANEECHHNSHWKQPLSIQVSIGENFDFINYSLVPPSPANRIIARD
ncbi:hypothetical protein HUJ05_011339 [Dendroctonus ponderosae]|nr:hypothetical protein HUJ05_011339 [Dendroctonus ponderosae]